MIRVVIAAYVNHEGVTFDFIQVLEARRQHGLRGCSVACDIKGGQITFMAVAPGSVMLAGILRVPVTACGACRHVLAIDFCSVTAGFGMNMESMYPWLQPF